MGSSAGGHLAASLANLTDNIVAPNVKPADLKHAASILLYPVISFNEPYRHKGSFKRLLVNKSTDKTLLNYYSMENQVSEKTPPTFLVHALDDASVTFKNSIVYMDSLKNYGVVHKIVLPNKGGHGFGLNFKKTGSYWINVLKDFLQEETQLFSK
jgi:acetyl esterase/lipase